MFFSINPDAISVRRFALLRQFLTSKLGDNVNVIDYASLSFGCYKFIIVAEADSCETLETALSPCDGVFEVSIAPITDLEIVSASCKNCYAVLIQNDPAKPMALTRNPQYLCETVTLNAQFELENELPLSSILFVESPSASQALQYGEYLYPQARVFVTPTNAPESLFDPTAPPAPDPETAPPAPLNNTPVASNFTVFNEGTSAVDFVYETVDPSGPATTYDYYNFFKQMQQIQPQSYALIDTACYLWTSPTGTFTFTWDYHYGIVYGTVSGREVYVSNPYSMQCNALPPKLYTPYIANTTLGFNIANNDGFHTRNTQYFWLNDLLNTTKYDAAFPEDSYTGDELAVYQYFVAQLGGAAPKTGTVASSLVQSVIDKGCPSNLNPTAFADVGAHLVKECSFFETADKWFGLDGIFSVINTQIAEVSSNDLTAAAALMQIQETSSITTTLDSFFSILEALVGMIPGAGSYIQGAVTIGWTFAKMSMGSGSGNAPIEESIANMADKINSYLNNMQEANINIRKTIYGNWGKLETFTEGTMGSSPIISEDQFAVTYNSNGGVQLPQGYIDAAAKAWKLTVYQTLFAGFHTPQCNMVKNKSNPANNPWNPDAGNYEYIYYLDTVLYDSNGNSYAGFMEFDCRTNAPTEVLQILFGSNSEFNLNPVVFFTGINGWKVQNIYDQGNLGNFDSEQYPSGPDFPSLGILV